MATARPQYKHTQVGYSLLLVLAAILVVALIFGWGRLSVVPYFVLVAIAILFGSLTVIIDDNKLEWYFGPKFWRKTIRLNDIKATEVVTNKWWYGFGIRLTPHGWLYNVSGIKALQIRLSNGKKIRIGTDEPEAFHSALTQQIKVIQNKK